MSRYINCVNCGKEVICESPNDRCYFCGELAGCKDVPLFAQHIEQELKVRYMPLGRPRTGEWRKCKDCGEDIYVRRYRMRPGIGQYCKGCYGKNNPPPKRTKKEASVNEQTETPTRTKPVPQRPKEKKDLWKYFDFNKEIIIADYQSMTILNFLATWHITTKTWNKLKKLWDIKGKKTGGRKKGTKNIKKYNAATAMEEPNATRALSEHEEYLILLGYQMAVRELLQTGKLITK